jgi:YidC/Oxa1 family membrane protein insertase
MTTSLAALLVYLTQCLGGSLGWAIVALSIGLRVALLPLTLRLSRRMLRNQQILRALQPELAGLRRRYKKKPERMLAGMQRLYRKQGYSPLDLPAFLGSFVQLPLFALVYRTIRDAVLDGGRFLWMRSLAAPDALLTLVILLLTAAAAYFIPHPSESARTAIIVVQVAVTGFIVWKLAAGLGLYWASSTVVTLGQNVWLRRRPGIAAAA